MRTGFSQITRGMSKEVILHIPDVNKRFVLRVYASDYAVGAVLEQYDSRTCQTCKTGPACFDECKHFRVTQYPFPSLAIDFVSLPAATESGQVFDQCRVIVDWLTGYVAAVPCHALGLDAIKAANSFWQCFLFLTGIPREIVSDNDNVITTDFFRSLCERPGIETHKGVIYRPYSNERAEDAVTSVVNVLRLYLEQPKATWVLPLALALSAINDLLGIHSLYSPHTTGFWTRPYRLSRLSTSADRPCGRRSEGKCKTGSLKFTRPRWRNLSRNFQHSAWRLAIRCGSGTCLESLT